MRGSSQSTTCHSASGAARFSACWARTALIYAVRNLRARVEALLEQFDLLGLSDTKCGLLSSGEQTRVALAKALLNAPDLLLLDEPTASLDPAAAQSVRRHIQSLARQRDCGTFSTCSPRRCASPNTSPGSC
jgi:ABC-type multidrug transport system ATPase subunit